MASKYADIVKTLPRSYGTDPDFQEKVNAVKRKILEPTTEEGMSTEAIEDLILEITAMQSVVNDALIRGVGGAPIASSVAKVFVGVRKMKNAYNEQEKITNILVEAYEQILINQYEIEETTSLKLDDGAAVRIQYEPHGAVTDKEANRLWAIENGMENSLSLPWQTVNALTKEALLRGEEPPAGVECTTRTKVVYTKA